MFRKILSSLPVCLCKTLKFNIGLDHNKFLVVQKFDKRIGNSTFLNITKFAQPRNKSKNLKDTLNLSKIEEILRQEETNIELLKECIQFEIHEQETKPFFQEQHSKKAEQLQNTLDSETKDLVSLLNNCGCVLANLGHYQFALDFHKRTLKLKENIYSEEEYHPEIAISLSNIASVYYHLGEYHKAQEYCNKAITMQEQIYQIGSFDLAYSLNLMGIILLAEKNYKKGFKFQRRSLEINEILIKGMSPVLANTLSNLGFSYFQYQQYKDAYLYFERSIKMKERLLIKEEKELALTHYGAGVCLREMGQVKSGISHLNTAYKMFNGAFKEEGKYIQMSLLELGNTYAKLQDYQNALAQYKLALQEEYEDYDQNILFSIHKEAALSSYNIQKYQDTLQHSQEAKKIQLSEQALDQTVASKYDQVINLTLLALSQERQQKLQECSSTVKELIKQQEKLEIKQSNALQLDNLNFENSNDIRQILSNHLLDLLSSQQVAIEKSKIVL
ncbi:hypothetical protein ABPG72_010083 [Tetrahymena utriculariae]